MKRDVVHSCAACGRSSPRWFGRCPDCGEWNSAEAPQQGAGDGPAIESLARPASAHDRIPITVGEVDRVLGGGLVAGSAVLLAGEPGIGKSTLILQLADALQRSHKRCLLVSGEESLDQIGLRARRLGLDAAAFRAAATTSLTGAIAAWESERPEVVVVDSVQAIADDDADQIAGSPAQVRAVAAALVRSAKGAGAAVIMIGHVTKDGNVAGPKTLEHMVDVVLVLEGERSGSLRLLRAAKNRFGSCEETGVFSMTQHGLEEVADPSAMLLADRRTGIPGSIVFPSLEGTRPVLVEVQALVSTSDAQARRVSIGFDARRLSLLLGVLSERAEVKIDRQDVFVAAAGGIAVREPSADLALGLAIASACKSVPIDPTMIAVGELGLAGEIRAVPGLQRRLAEARRLGFGRALVPKGFDRPVPGMQVTGISDVREAVLMLNSGDARPTAVAS